MIHGRRATDRLAQVIEEELYAAFGDHFLARNDGRTPDNLRVRVAELGALAADRAATRMRLDDAERAELTRELPRAVAAELALEARAASYNP